jgi:hypothetical protein
MMAAKKPLLLLRLRRIGAAGNNLAASGYYRFA